MDAYRLSRNGRSSALRLAVLFLLAAIPLLGALTGSAQAASAPSEGSVYVVPLQQTVQSGLASFLDRALADAEKVKASLVVLDIDTPGGKLATAEEIGKRIRESKVPTVAYVSGKAASAGAYLALSAGGISMAPGTTIGAAMIVDGNGNAVDNPKLVSFWSEEMASAAQINGRDRNIAVAMVDPSRVIELKAIGETKEKGQILSLSAEQALKVGYADNISKTVEEVIAWKGLSDRPVVEFKPSFAERVAEVVTGSGVSTLLLIIGIAGVAIEFFVPGFGIPGIVGLLAFSLYFFGQSIAGFAGMEAMVVFIIGIGLLVLEAFIPSFGILGILGIAALITGITMGAYDTGNALRSLGIAVIVAAVIVSVVAYIFRKRGIWNKFILKEQLTTEKGFVPQVSREQWIGQEGTTTSMLRPSGVADFGGQRLDVITSGEFIEAGKPVRVVSVDGTRILVKEI
ncbi:nodulation protein NfeD [Cohnella endophytica]|uniref:Nodulation protein NfeD n=1 Tax=Cohnella endophytica TaxID=2419778 RepID=A0A494Y0V2_9BACL|nr:nodulation protein NfeD [Cohnella endophytica]RKP55618.1 nodulation protein NfeD [Cohnella endophytica]